jgi:hypothetical protein
LCPSALSDTFYSKEIISQMGFAFLSAEVSMEGYSMHARPESSGDDADIMESKRRLTERDICVVASQLGESWRVLGLRLNFKPETLDAIARSTCVTITNNVHGKVSVASAR